MNTKTVNPYVGPRTFQESERDRFFGREREARDLLALAVSEQLVLFYAQSGAGKSSLVNTCLIPDLRRKDFEVFSGRVIGDPPSGLEIENIYVFNLIRSLIPGEVRLDWLARMTLKDYFQKVMEDKAHAREIGDPGPHVLIIDQFEELFSTHQDAWEKREGFFRQIANAMEADRFLWVILVMREDFIAALDAYAHILPGRLRMRYYMQRLEHDAALDAIKKPVLELRPFDTGVAENLLDNLARIKVKLPDGTLDERPGQYVEPVQLQVVCYSLWEHLERGTRITMEDLNKVGDVDQALEKFYDGRVKAVAKDKRVEERQIREWFAQEMITAGGTRNMVLRNQKGGQLDDGVIQALQGDLVRADTRGGQTWYELSHDRLIEPIQTSNTKWFAANLSIFQQQAALWAAQGRPEGMLLRGRELEQAEIDQKKAIGESRTVPKDEIDFLAACILSRERELREKRDNLRLRILAIGMAIFLVVAIGLAGWANSLREDAVQAVSTATYALGEKNKALNEKEGALAEANRLKREVEEQKSLVLAEALAGEAQIALNGADTVQLGRLLSVEAYRRNKIAGDIMPSVYQALFDSIKGDNVPISNKPFSLAAFSPGQDMNWLVLDNDLWNLYTRQRTPLGSDSSNPVTHGSFRSQEKLTLVTWDYFNYFPYAFLVDVYSQNVTSTIPLSVPGIAVDNVFLSDNGRWIAVSGVQDKTTDNSYAIILVWDATEPKADPLMYTISKKEGQVQDMVISPEGKILVATSYSLYLWQNDKTDLYEKTRILIPDSSTVDISTFQEATFQGRSGSGLQLSPDGAWLARLTDDKIYIHQTSAIKEAKYKMPIPSGAKIQGLMFSQTNDSLIYVASNFENCTRPQGCQPSASVYQYPLDGSKTEAVNIYTSTTVDITAMDISQDGKLIIGDENGYIRIWDMTADLVNQSPQIASVHAGEIVNILVGPDNQTVASASSEDGTRIWKLTEATTDKDAAIINRILNRPSIIQHNESENNLVVAGINTENALGSVHVYSEYQTPNQSPPHDDAFVSSPGSTMSAVATCEDWIAAARTDKPYNYREATYSLDFWARNPGPNAAQFVSFPMTSEVTGLAFYPDGRYLAIAAGTGELWMDDTRDLKAILDSTPLTSEGTEQKGGPQLPHKAQLPNDLGTIKELIFTRNGRHLIAASAQGVGVWDMQKPLSGMYPLLGASLPIQLSTDQQWLAVAGTDNFIQILDLQTLSSTRVPLIDQTPVINFAFNSDDTQLAVAHKSGQVFIFQFPVKTSPVMPLSTLHGAVGDITWMEFNQGTSTGQWLAASGGNQVYLWNLASPNVKSITLQGYNGTVIYAGFTEDGEWIITVAEDQTIRFWSMNLEKLRLAACKFAGRNLTLSEWQRYFPDIAYNEENANSCPEFKYGLEVEETVQSGATPLPVQTLPFIQPPTPTPQPILIFIQYVVKEGDTLDLIALTFNMNWSIIMEDNNILNPNLIRVGQVLNIRVTSTPNSP